MAHKPHSFLASATPTPRDIRDYSLGSLTPPVDYPSVFMQDNAWNAEMYYQAQQPACGAHSGVWLKALLDSYESKPRKYSPRFTWIDIKTFDGHALQDGTDMRSIFKSLAKKGAADLNLLPNKIDVPLEEYADPKVITKEMVDNAQPRIIKTYAFENGITFEGLKRAIYTHRAVLVRVEIGEEWWTNKNGNKSWKEADILPLRPVKQPVGGHFVVLHSYDEDYIYFANSFSKEWGRGGHGYFGRNYMPFVTDGGTAVDVPDGVVTATIKVKSLLEQILAVLLRRKR